MENRNIVITGIQPWDIEIGSNCKNIAIELAKNNRVLYVNAPLDRSTLHAHPSDPKVIKRVQVIRKERANLEKVSKNLWVYTPPVILESWNWLPYFLFKAFNKGNSEKFALAVNDVVKKLQFSNVILFTDSDMFRSFDFKEILRPELFIYYTRDNLMTVPYWHKHGQFFEPAIMKKADLVVANSPHLASLAKQYNRNSHYIGQGCDVDEYLNQQDFTKPEEFKNLKGPVIGYVGLLTGRRLDIEMIKAISNAKPEWNIVLVGPEEQDFKESALHNCTNVHFLGAKQPEELYSYIQSFDVCINPQIVNELTKGNYPRKIDEYLACGKPVVATNTPTMDVFKNHCYLALNLEEYLLKIEEAMQDNSPNLIQSRKEFAASHTWENSIAALWQALGQEVLVC